MHPGATTKQKESGEAYVPKAAVTFSPPAGDRRDETSRLKRFASLFCRNGAQNLRWLRFYSEGEKIYAGLDSILSYLVQG